MTQFYKGAIAVHKPTNKLFRAEHLRNDMLFPGESSVCFKAQDCRVASADDIPTNRPFIMRVGDVFIHIRFDEELDQFIVTDGNKCIGVRIPLEHCEFFEQAVGRFARFFDGAIVNEADEPDVLAHWKDRPHDPGHVGHDPGHVGHDPGSDGVQSTPSEPGNLRALHAITLHRPWAYAIAHLGKDVENRSWKCQLSPGAWIAIHAGKTFDKDALNFIRSLGHEVSEEESDHPMGIVAIARFRANVTESDSPWFFGPYGLVLDEVRPIESVPCRGKQRLWVVPKETRLTILENLRRVA